MTTLAGLWGEFDALDKNEQIDILKKYTYYVADYPEDHDGESYPASFLEWWTNDYEEGVT